MKLRLGTRGSELARTQSGHVADALRALGHDVEVVTIRSEGDVTTGSLVEAGGLGVFAATLRRALLAGEVDLAVHSLKDLPTAPVPGLLLGAIPTREDPADVLCARDGLTLATLPPGARVGTGSPRRAAQVRAARRDLTVVEIRGNVGTRLARVYGSATTEPDLDAVVLARAGLARLGLLGAVTDDPGLLPAPGQGALAVECRADDHATRHALGPLNDRLTRIAVEVERGVLATLGAGCAAPVGAWARARDGWVEVDAAVWAVDGSDVVTCHVETQWSRDGFELGRRVALQLLHEGASEVTALSAGRPRRSEDFPDTELWAPGTDPALVGRRVLLPRPDGPLAEGIRRSGALVDAVPLTRRRAVGFTLPDAPADWVVFTSAAGVGALLDAGHDVGGLAPRVAAVGRATADALVAAGVRVDLVGEGDAAALVSVFPDGQGVVLAPGSALASTTLTDGLAARGWSVARVATYTSEPLAVAPPALLADWDSYDAVVLTAGSVARAVAGLLAPPAGHTRVVALGRPTETAARAAGLPVHATAATPDAAGVLSALVTALKEPA